MTALRTSCAPLPLFFLFFTHVSAFTFISNYTDRISSILQGRARKDGPRDEWNHGRRGRHGALMSTDVECICTLGYPYPALTPFLHLLFSTS